MPRAASLLTAAGLFLIQAAPLPCAATDSDSARGRLRIETDVSQTTNLIHWVDNLAGTSIGKTTLVYRRYWLDRFGPNDTQDAQALATFARIRRLPIPTGRGAALNDSGCLPQPPDLPSWHQIFMTQAMTAR